MEMIAFCIGICAALIVFFLNLDNFPEPTGISGVGKRQEHLVDKNRQETNVSNGYRELMVHIWYPTNKETPRQKTFYDHDALTTTQKFINHQTHIPRWLLYGLGFTKTYTIDNAPISPDQKTFPIIIASHGSGPIIQEYSWLFEELASHGYIVIGINHPYMADSIRFPDDRVIKGLLNDKRKEGREATKQWKQEQLEIAAHDVTFVIDSLDNLNKNPSWPLFNKLDLNRIGICGHSAAGSLAMRLCLEDKRIKAGVGLDSGTRCNPSLNAFSTPFLVLLGENSRQRKTEKGKEDYKKLMKLSSLPGMNMNVVMIKNIGHSFSDVPLLLHSTLLTQILSLFIKAKVDTDTSSAHACTALKIAQTYVVKFFDEHLKK